MNRRSLLSMVIAAPALVALVAACGDDSATPASPDVSTDAGTDAGTGIVYPTGADDVVLRLGHEGGFVAPGTAFVNLPTLLVSGDGRVFQPAPTTLEFPGKLVPPMLVQSITPAGIQRLLQLAADDGLLAPPPDYSADIKVADVPDTVLELDAEGGSFVHRAPALGFNIDANGNPAPESSIARQRLASFVTQVGDLESVVGAENLGAPTLYAPERYRFQAMVLDPAQLAGMDPQPTLVDWPSDSGVSLADSTECGSAPADSVGTVLTEATHLTLFREGGSVYSLAAIGMVPGDVPC